MMKSKSKELVCPECGTGYEFKTVANGRFNFVKSETGV